jgi:hypothetical protein
MTNTTVDSTTELYELPDLKPAITDYLDCHHPNFTHMIGGRRQAVPDCQLPFHHIQIWCKVRIQLYSSYNLKTLLPSKGLQAFPSTVKWPFDQYNSVVVLSDRNKDWPQNGLHG